ncbi:hypothetical protein LCGC14_2699580, partial [marine sediment metagenome]
MDRSYKQSLPSRPKWFGLGILFTVIVLAIALLVAGDTIAEGLKSFGNLTDLLTSTQSGYVTVSDIEVGRETYIWDDAYQAYPKRVVTVYLTIDPEVPDDYVVKVSLNSGKYGYGEVYLPEWIAGYGRVAWASQSTRVTFLVGSN